VLLLDECFFLFISLSIQSGNFWIHPRVILTTVYRHITFLQLIRRLTSSVSACVGNRDIKMERNYQIIFVNLKSVSVQYKRQVGIPKYFYQGKCNVPDVRQPAAGPA
jgi:hypothetical protein